MTSDKTPDNSSKSADTTKNKWQSITAADIDITIQSLKTYVDIQEINPFLSALETLKTEPQNETFQRQTKNAFNDLGIMQGAVLTYAPYLIVLLSDNPFGDD